MTNEIQIINKYNSFITHTITYGSYTWCTNPYCKFGSGFFLNNINNDVQNSNILHKNGCYKGNIINIHILFSSKLHNDTDVIHIYKKNNELIHYSVNISNIVYTQKIKMDNFDKNEQLRIEFRKYLPKTQTDMKWFKPSKEETIHTDIFNVSSLLEFGNTKDCNICLSTVDDNNKYITECGHLFHLSCMFEHFEKNNLLHETHENCHRCNDYSGYYCKKPLSFNCIVCNKHINNA